MAEHIEIKENTIQSLNNPNSTDGWAEVQPDIGIGEGRHKYHLDSQAVEIPVIPRVAFHNFEDPAVRRLEKLH